MSGNLDLNSDVMTAYSNVVEYLESSYVIYRIDEAESVIIPEIDGLADDEDSEDDEPDPRTFDDFLAALPADECRWGLCAMDLGSYGSLCSFEPVLFTWLPEAAPAAQRRLYEESTAILTRAFDRVLVLHTATDHTALSNGAVLDRLVAAGPPRELPVPDREVSVGRLAPKTEQLLMQIRDEAESETATYGHAIFKINRFFLLDVAQTGDPAAPYDEFLAGLPADDCRWGLYTLDIRDLGSDSHPTLTFFFTWIPGAAPEKTRGLYYSGSDGTAMGAYEAGFTPTGIMSEKVGGAAEYYLGDVSDHSAVTRDALWEKARRMFRPTESEQEWDKWEEKKLTQEERDAEQDDRIRQGEVQDGGIYN
ncbi:hypothetical protein GT755_29975 [Herbidospora sp. NEAU-GS84]|uniref:ADF-H domain-containing protein n=1 Tax=Herbidospora solisilvae TaxID=2696284 RepID=A0A7C9NRX2_9ACTN|nr:hypothetical protein [Herbidospora solisilvae]NAS25896.1 hypothetical protein [Herbidospora solisilvae]